MSIYIAFGSNQAFGSIPPRDVLCKAAQALEAEGIKVEERSSLWQSPAWPDPSDPSYLNAVARIETSMDAAALLSSLHAVENLFGRVREARNAPRTLDLDIVDFDGQVSSDPAGPVLPHPRAHQRAFVLLPLREIAPGWTHPVSREPVDALIEALPAQDIAMTRHAAPFPSGT